MNRNSKFKNFSAVFLVLATLGTLSLSGCGVDVVAQPKLMAADIGNEPNHAIDIVKLISTSITDKNSDKSYFQPAYTIGAESRLLLRYKALSAVVPRIRADQPVYLRISIADGEKLERAVKSLQVCPVTSQWNMSATWLSGGLREQWAAGGDLDLNTCVKAIAAPATATLPATLPATVAAPMAGPMAGPTNKATVEAVGACTGVGAVCFDVSAWYRNYVVAQGSFDGLALISVDSESVQIIGETAGSKAPWLQWSESTLAQ